MKAKPVQSTRPLPRLVAVMLLVWLAAVGACVVWMTSYSNQQGRTGIAPQDWESAMSGMRQEDHVLRSGRIGSSGDLLSNHRNNRRGATMLFFVHPRCPCSWASARQLERVLLSDSKRLPQTLVYLYQPKEKELAWGQTALAGFVADLPNSQVCTDFGGLVAKKFGVMTSGAVLVYDVQGELRFNGGVTSSRGHEGDSIGSMAVEAILNGEEPFHQTAPVFGCELFDPTEREGNRVAKSAG